MQWIISDPSRRLTWNSTQTGSEDLQKLGQEREHRAFQYHTWVFTSHGIGFSVATSTIITSTRVTAVHHSTVYLSDGRTIPATTLIWAAGNAPNPLVAVLPTPKSGGRILADEYLSVKEFPGIWALGDCASIPDHKTGGFHPPTAQHAIREAKCAARNVAAEIVGGKKKSFGFSTLGRLAAIGRRTGVARIFGLNFSGFFAWWLWRTIYLFKLPRLEKKMRVALDWTLEVSDERTASRAA